jgi:hypothetical protein
MIENLKKYYKGSMIVTIFGIALAYYVGYAFGGTSGAALSAVFTAVILSILEVSLSIDNAVVNAKVLKDMDPVWRHRFITWGMLIAVFGMRLVFPLLIVSFATGLWPIQNPLSYIGLAEPIDNVFSMAIQNPEQYEKVLHGAHAMIMGFGGSFLMMVFLKFFIDEAKDNHWIDAVEDKLAILGKFEAIQIFLTIALAYVVSKFAHTPEDGISFFIAAVAGTLTFIAVDWLEVICGSSEDEGDFTTTVAKNGLAGFIYLEVLDASFSFDGVVGAFALTNNIFIILIGLGIGAMFVRSVTIQLVEKGTLNEFCYLEHAAFWAIGALASIMYINVITTIPEMITGLIGATLLAIGIGHSVIVKRREQVTA